jgi:alpha-glucosidase (family GH31 glycosyl hydrolase)
MTNYHKTSIDIIRAGQAPTGAYVASPTFSQYGYSWLRDGTWIAYSMDRVGEYDSAEAFYRWVGRTLVRHQDHVEKLLAKIAQGLPIDEKDYLPTRFTVEGEPGSDDWWDFQLDGYGTWLWGLVEHIRLAKSAIWDEVRPAVVLTVRYLAALWQSPNYDCWEENRQQIHTATLAAIYAGLRAVQSHEAGIVPDGLPETIHGYTLRECLTSDGHFAKYIGNPAVDASLLWVAVPYNLVDVRSPEFTATLAKIEHDLHRENGGVYRYAADTYFGGGEWILLTAWLGWAYVRLGRIEEADSLRRWIEAQAAPSGELPEQVADHALDSSRIEEWIARWGTSASPLLWSHAMVLILESELQEQRKRMIPIHTPYGQEHPYEQLPEERFPRNPLAETPFRVGIATRPAGGTSWVRVHTQLNGEQHSIDAVRQTNWQPELEQGVGAEYLERIVRIEQDVWHAELTAPPIGQTLTYWIESPHGQTGEYTLIGQSWQQGGQITQNAGSAHTEWCVQRGSGNAPHAEKLPHLREVAWLTDGEQTGRVRLAFEAAPDEAFYGLGERFNALNQRGNTLDIRVFEEYKNQGKRTYMPIPFLVSSKGYGVYIDSARYMRFDLAHTDDSTWIVEADLGADESLRLVWFTGDDPFEIAGHFTQYTGPAVLPPLWSFGLWMSGNEWNSQARVVHEVEQSLIHDIQPSVIVLEAWSDETTFYIWNDAQYTPKLGSSAPRYGDFTFPPDGKWTDPKSMVGWLHENDIRVLLWQIPVFKSIDYPHAQHDADRTYFEQSGFGVRDEDGSMHRVRPFWFRGGYIWDVTNPNAREWWLNKRAYLLDEVGIDGFKTDGGEHMWGASTRFYDGRSGDELWNVYPQLYSEAYYQFANARRESMTFSRAGFVGSQRSPAHWAGDENSTWDAFRHSILAGLSAGMSGIPFWGWDLAGFSGEPPTAELFLRSAAMAAFCPIMQYHSEYNAHREPKRDRTPWNMEALTGDDRVIPTFRHFVNVRHNLMPYIWQEAQHSAATGQPMMRALRILDSNASDYQYLFGRDLLVCPVVEEGVTTQSIYLPAGKWSDLFTKTQYTGGQTIQMAVPLNTIPVFVREGAQIPVQLGESGVWGRYVPLTKDGNTVLAF